MVRKRSAYPGVRRVKFTDKTVAALTCPEGKRDRFAFDDEIPGFGVRATAKGAKWFVFQYGSAQQKRRVVIGAFGKELTVAAARKKAEELRGQVRSGHDPVFERRAAAAERARIEAEAKAAAARAAYTVESLIAGWTEDHLSARSASYRAAAPAQLRRALKDWLSAPAASFTRTDAVQAMDATKANAGPVAANRLRAEARACWGWAVKRGALEGNPWDATPRPLAREIARERVLSDEELAALYKAAGQLDAPWDTMIRLLILTGQRRGEVAGMRWEELDLEKGLWSLPGERTKNHEPHAVPLSEPAIAALKGVHRRKGAEFVFEGPRKTPMSGFGKVKTRLDKLLADALKRTVQPWVIHDLRRTAATGLQRLGVRLEVTEAVLNHVSGSKSGIVGVYQRHGWEKEKAEALKGWAAHVLGLLDGRRDGEKVVELRRA